MSYNSFASSNIRAFGDNCFDVIRLVAAVSVMLGHIVTHLQLPIPRFFTTIHQSFPGVIVLFFLSGYLITASAEREKNSSNQNKTIRYALSRFFRIYPALIVCLVISIISIIILYNPTASFIEWMKWIGLQITIGQFYSPSFLEGFGVGAPNGSLWTIPIEIQWYIIAWIVTPWLKRRSVVEFILLIIGAIILSCVYPFTQTILPRPIYLLIDVTVIPYLYLFLLGSLLYYKRESFGKAITNYWWAVLSAYLLWSHLNYQKRVFAFGTYCDVITGVLLSLLVFSCGYTFGKVRLKTDLSYGIYIYHMVVVNIFVHLFGRGSLMNGFIIVIISLFCSLLSWYCVEKPSGKLKDFIVKSLLH